MEILIGILCVPAGILALYLIVALFYAFGWLFEHGLFHMIACSGLCSMFGFIAQRLFYPTSYTIVIIAAIVGAVLGLFLYVHMEIEYIKEHAKDDES